MEDEMEKRWKDFVARVAARWSKARASLLNMHRS